MNISIICSSSEHPIYPYLENWINKNSSSHVVQLVNRKKELSGGEILFLVSCGEIIDKVTRDLYKSCLVIHASDLPMGRGWSPHIWQILEGKNELCVSLIEAEDEVDSGDIWKKIPLKLDGHELYDEINEMLFKIELELMGYAIDNYKSIEPKPQNKENESYYQRRTSNDSQIDPGSTILEQFNLLRVSDPDRYPAYFKLNGYTYEITIKKASMHVEND